MSSKLRLYKMALAAGAIVGLMSLQGFSVDPEGKQAESRGLLNIEGIVFQDKNGNGQQDEGEKGISGVVVSDGIQAVPTDDDGHYALGNIKPLKNQFIFIVTPSGYRNAGSFYQAIPEPACDANFNFGLITDPNIARPDFSFLQVTDLHVSDKRTANFLLDILREAAALKPKPAFVIATGDLVDGWSGVLAQFQYYDAVARLSPVPLINVPGNHDIMDSISNYTKTFGPTYYAFDYGGRHFVVLNIGATGYRPYEWLKNELALQPSQKEILVFQHGPPDAHEMKFLDKYNTRAVFSGHWHASRVFSFGKTLYVNTPPACFGGIDASARICRMISFRKGEIQLDDFFPGIGSRAAWKSALVRPAIAANAEKPVTGQDWPMFQHDRARTGITSDVLRPPLKLAWRKTLGGTIHISSPVVANGMVYIGVSDEENRGQAGVYALDAAGGTEKWHYRTTSSIKNTVCVGSNLVFAATVEGNMFALDAGTGELRWQYSLGSPLDRWMYSSPVVCEGVVYGGVAPAFVALNALNGKLNWNAKPMGGGLTCFASPAAGKGKVFVGFNYSLGLFALNDQTGEHQWNNTNGFSCTQASPSIYDQMLYVAADGLLYALDADNGKQIWKCPFSKWCLSSPVLAGKTVLIGASNGKILGLDSVTGEKRWVYGKVVASKFAFSPYDAPGAPIISSPAISGTTAFIGTVDGRFLALDTESGKELWQCELGAPVTSSAAISGNAVFIASYDGTVYAFVSEK